MLEIYAPLCESTNASSLMPLSLRAVPTTGSLVDASTRALPFEPAPLSHEELWREYLETLSFVEKPLSKDPRAQPEDFVASTTHMRRCMACAHYRARTALQNAARGPLDVGWHRQPLLDDYAIAAWLNVVRTLEAPAEQKAVLHGPSHRDVRFGCPCSAHRSQGGIRLWHASSGELALAHEPLDNHAIVSRWSPDGRSNFTAPQTVELVGSPHRGRKLKTFMVAQAAQARRTAADANLHPPQGASDAHEGDGHVLYAGYEGGRSQACLATSADGLHFRTISPRHNPRDNRACSDATRSLLGRAADAYVTPLAGRRDLVRANHMRRTRRMHAHIPQAEAGVGRDLVCSPAVQRRMHMHAGRAWAGTIMSCTAHPSQPTVHVTAQVSYRKDFGTATGWREIRGLQVVELSQRFSRLRNASRAAIGRVHAAWWVDRIKPLSPYCA